MNRIYEIDALRISGALIVMMYHYTFRGSIIDGERIPLFPAIEIVTKYGYLGIGLFFMISGFVIPQVSHPYWGVLGVKSQ